MDFVLNSTDAAKKKIRLELALEKAYEWQNSSKVDNYSVEKHGRTYYGPHKWIICLLGDDIYSIN